MHAIAYIVFILFLTTWLGKEFKRDYRLRTHWPWIAGAVVSTLVGIQIFGIERDMAGNFIQHMSGGVSCTLLFIYLCKTLHVTINWRLATALLFAFVCTLGVMNELAEYFFEFLGHAPFSVDSHDTWRDFVANTAGALLAWVAYGFYRFARKTIREIPNNN